MPAFSNLSIGPGENYPEKCHHIIHQYDTEPVTENASSSDTLPDGLVRELPIADEFQKPSDPEEMTNSVDDLDELRKQLEALNAD